MYFGSSTGGVQGSPKKSAAANKTQYCNKVKEVFTSNVAKNQCEDCKPKGAAAKKVSNLMKEPQINVKYDDAWFLK